MPKLAEWINARLDGEERDARACWGKRYVISADGQFLCDEDGELVTDLFRIQDGPHIVRQDPAATIARLEALRALVHLLAPAAEDGDLQVEDVARPALRLVAAIWRVHPDWREDWSQ